MHLLVTTPGAISNGEEAVDLAQPPGDIVILSAADSDLACFSRAAALLKTGEDGRPSVRLTNLLQLKHPYSVDLYLERTLSQAKFVAAALLGGRTYWPYGLDEIANLARERGLVFAPLPDSADASLNMAGACAPDLRERLSAYLRQGGVANAVAFLQTAARAIGADLGEPDDPTPLADAGLYQPGVARPTLADVRKTWRTDRPLALFVFYRALVASGQLDAVDSMMEALEAQGFNVVFVHVRALREPFVCDWLGGVIDAVRPDVIINATSFAASRPGDGRQPAVLERAGRPILQIAFAAGAQEEWAASARGLSPRDLAMHVALPEVDGRIFTRAVAFKAAEHFDARTHCAIVSPKPEAGRMGFVATLAANWAKLARTRPAERRIALILANYPNREGRIANGVGLDTPASAAAILRALQNAGYTTGASPRDGAALIDIVLSGRTNEVSSRNRAGATLDLDHYKTAFDALPEVPRAAMLERWGPPENDPFYHAGAFRLAVHTFGNVVVAVQPSRGYDLDPKASYHDPALPPPHNYLAFHIWLRDVFGAHAEVHVGKHGNLEWLPGKALSLSDACFPEVCAGPVPRLYPFIVNDPGEGTQAKRRIGAVIVDHLTPPLTRAESYGPLKQLEALVDEYYLAAGMDPRRLNRLRADILDLARSCGLDKDASLEGDGEDALAALDNYLCDLKEMQIRDGLHVFGASPAGALRRDLLIALARTPRDYDDPGKASILRALADDLGLKFDPLDCRLGDPWTRPRPDLLATLTNDPWRTIGDTIERLELFAQSLLVEPQHADSLERTRAVLRSIAEDLAPRVDACGDHEMSALLAGLDGRFIAPGPSGAPTRGRPDVLPTGRNFYSVDTRAVPTPTAWELGRRSAVLMVEDYLQRQGEYPKAMALSAWGTANMRTGGDDIAQALALMGVRPRWDFASGRVTGFEVLSLAELRRPRVDVTLRVSGFFRDAFPEQIDLIDSAARAIQALDESEADNPAAARARAEAKALVASGLDAKSASRAAGARVFGSKPMAYGAGLQALIDERIWETRADLAESYLDWGGYAYGGGADGAPARALFAQRLSAIDAIAQNQDNREHDLLDSDDYYQFEGGMAAAVEQLSGHAAISYHNDLSRPERPVVRTLADEIGRVVRARVTNPKWIAGVMRHGYKGAFEIAASVDYLFGFAAATDAVKDHHFDAVHAAFIEDETVRVFMRKANPAALRETAARLLEAMQRGLWRPKSNSAATLLESIAGAHHAHRS